MILPVPLSQKDKSYMTVFAFVFILANNPNETDCLIVLPRITQPANGLYARAVGYSWSMRS